MPTLPHENRCCQDFQPTLDMREIRFQRLEFIIESVLPTLFEPRLPSPLFVAGSAKILHSLTEVDT